MTYTIRLIEPKDNAAVEGVIRSCLIEFGANHEGTAWADPDLGRFSEIYSTPGNRYWVAEDETGKIVGGTGIGRLTDAVCELQKMYCLPQARGTGLGGQLMATLGISIFFYAIIQYTNALLQSHGYAHVPVITMLVCGVVRLAVVYLLSGNPYLGIWGVPLGGLGCYIAIAILNLLCIRKLVPQRPKLLKNLLRPLPSALIMGAVAFGTYFVMNNFLGLSTDSRLQSILLCGGPILVGAVIYFLLVVLTKAITREDCMLLPKGEKIANLLHL